MLLFSQKHELGASHYKGQVEWQDFQYCPLQPTDRRAFFTNNFISIFTVKIGCNIVTKPVISHGPLSQTKYHLAGH